MDGSMTSAIIIVVLWFLLGFLPAFIANSKGRGSCGWWIYSFLFWPIALIHALLMKAEPKASDLKQCPECKQPIDREARICHHCRSPQPAE